MAFEAPNFDLTEEELDDHTVVIRVAGEIHVTTAPEFSERLNDAIAGGKTGVVLDLTDVEFIDSTGLSVLLNGLRRVTRVRGRMALVVREPDRAAALRDHASSTRRSTSCPARRGDRAACVRPTARLTAPAARRRRASAAGQRDAAVVALAVLEQRDDRARPATAVPLSVCDDLRLAAAAARCADVEAARLEVGRVRASRSARGSGPGPGSHASQSYFLAAEAPRSSTAMLTTR